MLPAPVNATESKECRFSWGSFPEFFALHCELDLESILFIALIASLGVILVGYLLLRLGTARFQQTEAQRKEQDIRTRVTGRRAVGRDQPRCSFGVTLTTPADQEWFRCRTCFGISEMGCCSVCALRCHKGHDLEKSQAAHHRECRSCSCGASGRCQQNIDFDVGLKKSILEYYVQSDADEKISAPTNVRFYWHSGVDVAYFSAVLTNEQKEEDTRVFEYEASKGVVVSMGGPMSGLEEDTAAEAIAAEWDNVYNKIDVDGDGVLSSKEIQDYFLKNKDVQDKLSVSDQHSFELLLQRLDSDGDGVVDRSEFAVLVQELGLVSNAPTSMEVAVSAGKDLIAADVGGTSDPYVEVRGIQGFINNELHVTTVKPKTLQPIWNERFQFSLATSSPAYHVTFTVFDKDKHSASDFLGYADVKLGPNELSALVSKSEEMVLRLVARPGNAGDVQTYRQNRGKLGVLMVTLRAHVDVEGTNRGKKKKVAGRTLCSECRRMLVFIPQSSDTKQWMDETGNPHRLKRLPQCYCGAALLPDGWRDDLRNAFEHYRDDSADTSRIEALYPVANHISIDRLLSFALKVTFVVINCCAILLSWSKRPKRVPSEDFNLSILALVWFELIYLGSTCLYLIVQMHFVGVWGMFAMMPDALLGAHAMRILPIAWFPALWFRSFQNLHQKASLMHTRHATARFGIAVGICGCVLLFLPLPVYVVVAKLAFFRFLLGPGSGDSHAEVALTFTDAIIAINLANNIRNVMDVVSDNTPTELMLPRRLWHSVFSRVRGPNRERLKTICGLITFPPHERSLPLLYEMFVLNRNSIWAEGEGLGKDDAKRNTLENTMQTAERTKESDPLAKPLLDARPSLPGQKPAPPGSPLGRFASEKTNVGMSFDGDGDGTWNTNEERLRNEVERLELESANARQDVRRLKEELRGLESMSLTASSPVQLAVRRVLLDHAGDLSTTIKHQLQQALAISEGRNKDLFTLVRSLVENPLLPYDPRKILRESLGGKYGYAKNFEEEPFALPSPPVIFPPTRSQLPKEHSQPVSIKNAPASPLSGSPPDSVANPMHPQPTHGEFAEVSPSASVRSPVKAVSEPVYDVEDLDVALPTSMSIQALWNGGGAVKSALSPQAASSTQGMSTRTDKARHFANLAKASSSSKAHRDLAAKDLQRKSIAFTDV